MALKPLFYFFATLLGLQDPSSLNLGLAVKAPNLWTRDDRPPVELYVEPAVLGDDAQGCQCPFVLCTFRDRELATLQSNLFYIDSSC